MCGITFVHRIDKVEAKKSILKRYHKQKSRGSDGFGYVAINKNKLVSYKRAKLESQIKEFIEKEVATTILFHHRFPTSTPNFKESAHPIKVSSIDLKYDYYLVHNGVISNADELKEKHEQLGFVYNTEITKKWLTSGQTYKESCFNDSEALAIEVALAIDKNTLSIESKGSIAFIAVQVHKSSSNVVAVYYGRNTGSPLKFSQNKNMISIGSETEGSIVPAEILHRLDLKTNIITCQQFEIPEYREYSNYGYGYYGGKYDKDDDDYEFGYYNKDGVFVRTDGYGTTFSKNDCDDDGSPAKQQRLLYNGEYGITEEIANRWNDLDWEIELCEQSLDKLEEDNDGSPESENRIVECEAILVDLIDERNKLDEIITRATLIQAENE